MTLEESIYYNNLRNNRNLNDYVFDLLFIIENGTVYPKDNVTFKLMSDGIPYVYYGDLDLNINNNLSTQNLFFNDSNFKSLPLVESNINEKNSIIVSFDESKKGIFSDKHYLEKNLVFTNFGSKNLKNLTLEQANNIIIGESILYHCSRIYFPTNDEVSDYYFKYNLVDSVKNSPDIILQIIYKQNNVENDDDIICIKLNNEAFSIFKLSNDSHILEISEKINAFFSKINDFNYSNNKLKEAILAEVEIMKIIDPDNKNVNWEDYSIKKTKKNIKDRNFRFILSRCSNTTNASLIREVLLLSELISKLKTETLEINNFIFYQNTDWNNYDFSPPNLKTKKFEIQDIIEIRNSLLKLESKIELLLKGDFSSGKAVLDFSNNYLLSNGSRFKWFNKNPFLGLTKEVRLNLLKKLIKLDFDYQRDSVRDELEVLDVINALFETCINQDDFYFIITSLESEKLLFELLNKCSQYGTFFSLLSARIGEVMKIKNSKNTTLLNDCIKEGNYFFLDTSLFTASNDESYNSDKKKIILNVSFINFEKNGSTKLIVNQYDDPVVVPLIKMVEFKTNDKEFNPLDWVILIPTEDITVEKFTYKKGQQYLLPACTAFLIFQKDTIKNLLKVVEITLNTLLITSGLAELTYALKAANALGIFLGASDLSITIANIATQDEEFARQHPDAVTYINYATWAYVLLRLNVQYEGKGIGDLAKTVTREVEVFINRLPRTLVLFLDKIPQLRKTITNNLLELELNREQFFKIDPKGIIVDLKLYKDAGKYEIISTLENAKIQIIIKKNGVEQIKIYRGTIEAVLNYDGKLRFRAKYVEGAKLDPNLVNATIVRYGDEPPFAINKIVTDFTLAKGSKFWILELEKTSRFGSFSTKIVCNTLKEAREKLVILEKYKPSGEKYIMREYEVIANDGLKVR